MGVRDTMVTIGVVLIATVVLLLSMVGEQMRIQRPSNTPAAYSTPPLSKPDWRWWQSSSDHHRVSGEVVNTSSRTLEHIKIVATFYNTEGKFSATGFGFLEIDPLLAGQASPFEFTVRTQPGMATAAIQFIDMRSGEVIGGSG